MNSENAADLDVLSQLVADGKVAPAVDRSYPLDEASEAIQYMVRGRARGKVAIIV